MGTVHLAKMDGPSGFRKLAVVKELRPDQINSPELVALFLAEARLAARLTHPNVVHTYGADEDHGRLYIAMEYLDGQPWVRVRHRLWQSRSLPLATHLRVLAETLAALHYAHEASDYDGTPLSVVHCDVSPHNVFVTYEGQVKILDFGVARAATTKGITRKDSFAGKLSYAAPEQLSGEELDRRVDIFAVGVMLWEALAGRPFVDMLDRGAVLRRRIMGNEPRVREVVPTVPRALADVCDRATACSREERFSTAAEFRHQLVDYLAKNAPDTDDEQLARLVSTAFREERAQIRSSIEGYLRTNPPPPVTLPAPANMPPPPPARSTLPPRPPTLSTPPTPLAIIAAAVDAGSTITTPIAPPPAPPPTSPPTSRASIPDLSQVGAETGIGENTMRADLSELASVSKITDDRALVEASFTANVKPLDAARKRPLLLGAAALGLLLLGWLFVHLISPRDETRAAAPDDAAHPGKVRLDISVQPEGAELYLDGAKLPSNPYNTWHERDTQQHTVRAIAPGRETQQWQIKLDSDANIAYQLRPAPARAPAPAPDVLSAAPAQPAPVEQFPRTAEPPAPPPIRSAAPAAAPRHSRSRAAATAVSTPLPTPKVAAAPAAGPAVNVAPAASPGPSAGKPARGSKPAAEAKEPALDERLQPDERTPRTIYEEDPYK